VRMTPPKLQTTTHQGIPLVWSDIRTTYTGTLAFAVGMRDEAPRNAGISHLVEHLVMSQVGKVSIMHNAHTEDDRISFWAQGPEALVADFLQRVAESIRHLDRVTEDVVAEQRAVISAELGEGDELTGSGPLLERFGAHTLGMLDLGAPAHRSHTREAALAHARTWLHSGNAVLSFTAEPPPTLDVTLPTATPMPARAVIEPLAYRRHGWIAGGMLPVVLSMTLDTSDSEARFVSQGVLFRAMLDELRTRLHLIYSVDGFAARTGTDSAYIALVLDPKQPDIVPTAQAALAILRSLASDGPSADLLAEVATESRHQSANSEVQASYLLDAAHNWVRYGSTPVGLDIENPESVTPEAVRKVLADALQTLLVSLGDVDTDLDVDGMSEALGLPAAKEPEGHYAAMSGPAMFKAMMHPDVKVFDPKWFKGLKGSQLILDPTRLMFIVPDQGLLEIDWSHLALAGVCKDCGHWDLTDHDGRGLIIEPANWRGGDSIARALHEKVPAGARYQVNHPGPPAK